MGRVRKRPPFECLSKLHEDINSTHDVLQFAKLPVAMVKGIRLVVKHT